MSVRGVIVEYDFAAIEGAEILFHTTRSFLKALDGIPFDRMIEARYLAAGNYQGGLAEYFSVVKTKKTSAKAARDLSAAFVAALNKRVALPPAPAFVNFIRSLVEKGLKVVISTRADLATVEPAFASLLGPNVVLHHEESTTYGSVKWDVWRRTCIANGLNARSIAVTGSGFGVKSALVAGLAAVAVLNDSVAYQDFSGADDLFKKLDGPGARRILEIMRIS